MAVSFKDQKDIQGHHILFSLQDKLNLFLPVIKFKEEDEPIIKSQREVYKLLLDALNTYIFNWCDRAIRRIQLATAQYVKEGDFHSLEGILQLDLMPKQGFKKRKPKKDNKTFNFCFEERPISLSIEISSSWERIKRPFAAFNRLHNHLTLEFIVEEKNYLQTKSEKFFLATLYKAKSEDERKTLLLDDVNWLELAKYGPNIMENIDLFVPGDPLMKLERPMPFPFWGKDRIQEIEANHPVINAQEEEELQKKHNTSWRQYLENEHLPQCQQDACIQCEQFQNFASGGGECQMKNCKKCEQYLIYKTKLSYCGKEDCELCHEYLVWRNLLWWYENIFLPVIKKEEAQLEELIFPDGTKTMSLKRLAGLIIHGPRYCAKSKFFQLLCANLKHRICSIKNRFHRNDLKNLANAWLILIEDFNYKESSDLQTLKSLMAGEETVIEGKWLSYRCRHRVPVVLICNEPELYWHLFNSPNFRNQCKFIDLGKNMWLGPPKVKKTCQTLPLLANANYISKELTLGKRKNPFYKN